MHRIGFNYANIHCIKISYMLHTCTCTYDYIIPIYVYIYIQIYIYASRHVQYYKHILLYKYILNIYIYTHANIRSKLVCCFCHGSAWISTAGPGSSEARLG